MRELSQGFGQEKTFSAKATVPKVKLAAKVLKHFPCTATMLKKKNKNKKAGSSSESSDESDEHEDEPDEKDSSDEETTHDDPKCPRRLTGKGKHISDKHGDGASKRVNAPFFCGECFEQTAPHAKYTF